MGIQIDRITNEEITGWNKNIEFTYDGEGYSVLLNWDTDYGYTIFNWSVNGDFIATPDWVESYKSVDPTSIEKGFFALCTDLDNISYEMEKVSA